MPRWWWRSEDKEFEHWTFFDIDDVSGNWAWYTLIFEKGVLSEWDSSRHFKKNGTLTYGRNPDVDTGLHPERHISSTDISVKR